MPHVGIERLGPGHREHHRAECDEGGEAVEIEEAQRVDRIERREDDRRMVDDMQHSEHREHQEIAEHDRPEQRSEEHTSELQSLMRISYAVFCLTKKKTQKEYR